MEGARYLPTISMSSVLQEMEDDERSPALCLDKMAIKDYQNNLYCCSMSEPFPWLLLEYPEEVRILRVKIFNYHNYSRLLSMDSKSGSSYMVMGGKTTCGWR